MSSPTCLSSSLTDESALAREAALAHWLRARGSVLVGFSGGVDSAYLATLAVDVLGRDHVLAVIGRSASYPASQWSTARSVADRFGIPVLEVDTDEMNDPRYAANPTNRCYFCKTELWGRLTPIARARGLAVVVDGTNADDLGDHRPGAAAAREHGVASPMADVGLTKDDIRLLSQRRGIPTWSQPSSPCLSSRLPYGTSVTPARLAQVERAESALRALGVPGDLRVRHHDDLARVELGVAVLQDWLEPHRAVQLAEAVRGAGFARVAIDLRGFRSGSLNVLGGVGGGDAVTQRPAPPPPTSIERLQRALDSSALVATGEGRGALAIVVPRAGGEGGDVPTLEATMRRWIVQAALAAGFSHVAFEIPTPVPDDAALPGGHPA